MRRRHWKMAKRVWTLAAAFVLAFPGQTWAEVTPEGNVRNETDVLAIQTAEQFLSAAARCDSEVFTAGKTWQLECDIDLSGTDFAPMGIFNGTLEGNGHTISGLSVSGAGSNQGLFRFVGESGTVRNLNVEGEIRPAGSGDNVGGIAGTNRGLIENCTFSGTAEGNVKTGGIAGYNLGTIRGCTNRGDINTSGEGAGSGDGEESISMDSMSLKDMVRTEKINDAGGIAGCSEGVIEDCENLGEIGCAQTGYNLGGIAGRQNGIVRRCENYGTVRGRKDVGGIVGQMEPFLTLRYEEDTVQALERQIDALSDLANAISDTADGTVDRAETDIDRIGDSLDEFKYEARGQRDYYRDQFKEWREDMDSVLDDLEDILDGIDLDPDSSLNRDVKQLKSDIRRARKLMDTLREDPAQPEVWSELRSCAGEILSGAVDIAAEGPGVIRDRMRDLADDLESMIWRLEDLIDLSRDGLDDLSADLDQTEVDLAERTDQVSDDIDVLKQGLKDGKNQLRSQKEQLKDQIRDMRDTVSDGIDRLQEDEDLITDLSGETDGEIRSAVLQCENAGLVEGDFQAGGIVGTLGVELEGEPEEDVDSIGDRSLNMVREMRATVALCKNTSDVRTKGDCAGGIVGRAVSGALVRNENYGDINADEGEMAGGIAGSSTGSLDGNYAFCRVYGGNYTGGIVGQGMDLSGNYAMVTLDGEPDSEWRGSIAGDVDADGSVSGNVYLENGVGAVDGVTYMDQAAAVTYEELLAAEGLPEEFKVMHVTFLADGQPVKVLKCSYGEAVSQTQIPEVPEKDGFEGSWETADLSRVTSNLRVQAVYRSWRTTIASAEGEKPVLLAEGRFHPADTLTVRELPEEERDALEAEIAAALGRGYRVVTAYEYRLPEGAEDMSRLHLWAGDAPKSARVAVADQGIVPSSRDGEYLIFEAGSQGTVAVLKRSNWWLVWVLAAAVLGGGFAWRRVRAAGKRRREGAAEEAEPAEENTAEKT